MPMAEVKVDPTTCIARIRDEAVMCTLPPVWFSVPGKSSVNKPDQRLLGASVSVAESVE